MCRYWLLDYDSQHANELFHRLLDVPILVRFLVFARVVSHYEVRLRIFCVTDDKMDKTLERHQNYVEVARSQLLEVSCLLGMVTLTQGFTQLVLHSLDCFIRCLFAFHTDLWTVFQCIYL